MTALKTHDRLPPLAPDIEIAHAAKLLPITDVAAKAGILPEELELFGRAKAKVRPEIRTRIAQNPNGKLILVTAMTATRFGEGKTVTSIGLAQALGRLGKKHMLALRQPSLGPVFGIKGGAAGGGHAQVVPMEDINLHFTGDFHAITAAHNLLAACVDNSVHFDNPLGIERITWRRVMDLCDRQLRQIEAGQGGKANGFPHETGFDITASSEIMACMALSEDLDDLQHRLENIIVGWTAENTPVYARDINCIGAMMALLRDAMNPNLVQTLEGTPALVHCGPFANIAHGCNSVSATRLGLKLAAYVVTEAGFAADLGAEKFFHIKCRQTGMTPDVAVLVVSCRALRAHGCDDGADWSKPDLDALRVGLENVRVHVENIRKFGVPVIIAANRFCDDAMVELEEIARFAEEMKTGFAVSEVAALGGEGGLELARVVIRVIDEEPSDFGFLYNINEDIQSKVETVAREVYRADDVEFSEEALESIARIERNGLGNLPICVAKTQMSISDDAKLRAAPTGWKLKVRDVRISNGAGFLVVICGKMLLMPGMPAHGVVERIHLDANGEIEGLS